ncbi:hypothetical protein [Pseudonocardia xishanensis]|uniref:Uncharacterized protein n=1 Tax=Pseudonocardia xishanensis TaxID=630995 RepID=A0ABP8RXD5_9PSEU
MPSYSSRSPIESARVRPLRFRNYPLVQAAKSLGAQGDTRKELVHDLYRLLVLNGVRPNQLIRSVVEPPATPLEVPTLTMKMTWSVVRYEVYEATLEIPADLPTEHIDKLLEAHEDRLSRTERLVSRSLGTWEVLDQVEAVNAPSGSREPQAA